MNKQPWRLVIVGDVVHVYNGGVFAMTLFDIGIALAAIDIYAKAVGRSVEYEVLNDPPESPYGGAYVVSVTRNPA
jgi:hypothetical protein